MSTSILERLRAEHASMAHLLRILDRQVALFERAQQPDYGLMEEIVAYFLDFPDQCHHPKEDMVAAKLLALAPNQAAGLRGLAAQHEQLAGLTRRFAKLLRRVLSEAELRRADILLAMKEFIASQRHHMQMEDEHFLVLAEKLLRPRDHAELEATIAARQDPLSGSSREQHYAKLRETIIAWEKARQS